MKRLVEFLESLLHILSVFSSPARWLPRRHITPSPVLGPNGRPFAEEKRSDLSRELLAITAILLVIFDKAPASRLFVQAWNEFMKSRVVYASTMEASQNLSSAPLRAELFSGVIKVTASNQAPNVQFCVEAPRTYRKLTEPRVENPDWERMQMGLERLPPLGDYTDCWKVQKLRADQTLTITYADLERTSPQSNTPPEKLIVHDNGEDYKAEMSRRRQSDGLPWHYSSGNAVAPALTGPDADAAVMQELMVSSYRVHAIARANVADCDILPILSIRGFVGENSDSLSGPLPIVIVFVFSGHEPVLPNHNVAFSAIRFRSETSEISIASAVERSLGDYYQSLALQGLRNGSTNGAFAVGLSVQGTCQSRSLRSGEPAEIDSGSYSFDRAGHVPIVITRGSPASLDSRISVVRMPFAIRVFPAGDGAQWYVEPFLVHRELRSNGDSTMRVPSLGVRVLNDGGANLSISSTIIRQEP